MALIMGYHVFPSIRGYWSTDLDLGVPFATSIMPLKKFEEIRS